MSSASLLAVGIFARESGQRLLTILDKLVDSAFRGLYDRARGDCASEYYQTGLRRVAMWTDETLSEDVARVRGACPDVEETVQQCFTLYVTERFDGKQRPTIACPPLLEFVRKFLDAMGQQRVVMDGSYFVRASDPIATLVVHRSGAHCLLPARLGGQRARGVRVHGGQQRGGVAGTRAAVAAAAVAAAAVADAFAATAAAPPAAQADRDVRRRHRARGLDFQRRTRERASGRAGARCGGTCSTRRARHARRGACRGATRWRRRW